MITRKTSPRAPHLDYSNGTFHIVINTSGSGHPLGAVRSSGFVPSEIGRLVDETWNEVGLKTGAVVHELQTMPNHVHVVLTVTNVCLSTIVRNAKGTVSRLAGFVGLWQRSFYDVVIRSDRHFETVCAYVRDNPRRWVEARE